MQFANRVKKQKKTKQNRTLVKNRKFCITFLDVVGIYLKESHYEKVHGKMRLQKRRRGLSRTAQSFLCQLLFSITNILILRSTHPKSYNSYNDFSAFQKTRNQSPMKGVFFEGAISEYLFLAFNHIRNIYYIYICMYVYIIYICIQIDR